MKDVTFFCLTAQGKLRQIPRNAPPEVIAKAVAVTLRLSNQKNGWKNVCIHQQANGAVFVCPVKALVRIYLSIRGFNSSGETFLSTYLSKGEERDVTHHDISAALKFAATKLQYPSTRGVPIDRIDTHSLRGGGANALSLSGFSDTQIQKMGRWKSTTFKTYIAEQLSNFTDGMSR